MTDPTGSAGRGRLAEVLATRGGRAEPEAPFVIELLSDAGVSGVDCRHRLNADPLRRVKTDPLTFFVRSGDQARVGCLGGVGVALCPCHR
jgi:hypothetical protein